MLLCEKSQIHCDQKRNGEECEDEQHDQHLYAADEELPPLAAQAHLVAIVVLGCFHFGTEASGDGCLPSLIGDQIG